MMTAAQPIETSQAEQPWTPAIGWERWHDLNAKSMRPLTEWFCRATALAPGQRVLDLACGTGLPSLAAAERVGPSGKVVATDLAPDMLAAAQRIARKHGANNIEWREMNAQSLDFPDSSFDAVTFSFGLMFCPDPVRAVSEMRRVLRPGGRFAVSVWDEPQKSPFFAALFGVIGRFVPSPPPDPKAPGMFRLAPASELAAVLRAGGFSEVEVESRPMTFDLASLDEHWRMITDMAAPARAAATTLPKERVAELRAEIATAFSPYLDATGLHIPVTPLCASGRK